MINTRRDVITNLCKTALNAPTAKNNMSALFSVFDYKEKLYLFRNKFYDKLQSGTGRSTEKKEALKAFINIEMVVNFWKNYNRDIVFRHAPHMVVASIPKNTLALTTDPIIALSYFELLANSMQIGALWLGLLTFFINEAFPELKEQLEIPEDNEIGYIMAFGKPAVKYQRYISHEPYQLNFVTGNKF